LGGEASNPDQAFHTYVFVFYSLFVNRERITMNPISRRGFLGANAAAVVKAQTARRPNVLLIVSDDQGYGDLSLHGNPHLKTPNLDSIGTAGVQLTQFHVSPVCAPTRSSLLTGQYNYRTGVVDTYLGRAMMYPDEVTLAEVFSGAGYRTGIFGKWHLGDNYPLRSVDQGFQESLVHTGGGLAQPAGPPGNGYFNPLLHRNGKPERGKGYCTDIFTTAAIEFMESNRTSPFFAYLATNAPHTPLEIDERYVRPFRKSNLDEVTAKVYGMVSNLDENVGRVLTALKKNNLERDTIVVFLTDNGPQQPRYNAGMRGLKGTVYEGGIRVPCFVRWPGRLQAGTKIDRLAAHIDLMPTLLELCGVRAPEVPIDGRSVAPLLRNPTTRWADRTLYFQWHRGDEPELFRSCAARDQRYKLVDGKELYDLEADSAEKRDLAGSQEQRVASMRKGYEAWFRDVSATRGYAPPRIYVGTEHENPVTLTRQDWRGPRAGWEKDSLGYWEVDVRNPGRYEVVFRMPEAPGAGEARFSLNGATPSQRFGSGASEVRFAQVTLSRGPGRAEASLVFGGKSIGPHYVDLRRLA
jgi:arylsulfatase A-like enzyme